MDIFQIIQGISRETFEHSERLDGSNRFIHAERMLEIYSRLVQSGNLPESPYMNAAIMGHDLVDNGHTNEDKNRVQSLQQIIDADSEILDEKTGLTKGEYVAGIIFAADRYEEAGESWRLRFVNSTKDMSGDDHDLLEESLINAIKKNNPNFKIEEDQQKLNSLKKFIFGTLSSNGQKLKGVFEVPDDLWAMRAPMMDPEFMIKTLQEYDIEGLVLKCIELIDNLRFPHPHNKVAGWKDAQEVLGFFAPLLELAGFDEMSSEMRAIALNFLHAKGETLRLAYDGESKSINIPSLEYGNIKLIKRNVPISFDIHPTFENIIVDSLIEQRLQVLQLLGNDELTANLFDSIMTGMEGQEVDIIMSRIKSVGSGQQKCLEKPSLRGVLPDAFGLRIVTKDKFTDASELKKYCMNIFNGLAKLNQNSNGWEFEPAHPDPEEPYLEITYGDNTPKVEQIQDGKLLTVVNKKRKSGYQSAHMNIKVTSPNGQVFYIEIQLTDAESHEVNEQGIASHTFYKASQAFGEIGRLTRELNRIDIKGNLKTIEDLSNEEAFKRMILQEKKRLVGLLRENVYGRSEIYKNAQEFKLTPNVLAILRATA